MTTESLYDLLLRVLGQIATDIVTFLPGIFLTILVLVVTAVALKLLNKFLVRVLGLVDLDGTFKALVKTALPFSLNSLIIALIDIGVVLIAIFGLADILIPQRIEVMREIVGYGLRIVSVVAIVVLTFVMFNMFVERMRIETRMRGYVVFLLLILVTVMVIDLSALSESTKQALGNGLSTGLGIAIGVFAVWFFFHEYFDRILRVNTRSPPTALNRPAGDREQ
jgi:hypothetical protein